MKKKKKKKKKKENRKRDLLSMMQSQYQSVPWQILVGTAKVWMSLSVDKGYSKAPSKSMGWFTLSGHRGLGWVYEDMMLCYNN